MIREHRFRKRHLAYPLVGFVISLSTLGNPAATAAAASWSPEVVTSASQPSTAPSAFAINPTGSEVWVTAPGVQGGVAVEVAQRPFGGTWSPLATIATISTVGASSVQSLSVSISANNNAAAAWLFGGGVEIALRSPTGAWQAPVHFAAAGGASNLLAKLDAQGNGVAAWSRLTAAGSVVEAVAWTSTGTFGTVVQLSPSGQGAFLPDIAVNEAGTAVVVWQAAAPLDNSNPYQVESATRPVGGAWSAATAVSPVTSQTWTPRVALDGSGGATVVWEQDATVNTYRIYAATRPAGGTWGSPTRIEPSNWYFAGQDAVNADAVGNITATWVVEDTSGVMSVRTATLPAGAQWGAPTSLGQCSSTSTCVPHVAAARDGSIAVVGWAPYGGTIINAAVRLGLGAWVPMAVGSGSAQLAYVVAMNNARASAVWPVSIGVRYKVALKQSDFR